MPEDPKEDAEKEPVFSPQIIFTIDFRNDLGATAHRLSSLDPYGIENRIREKGINPQVAMDVSEATTWEDKIQTLRPYMEQVYQEKDEAFRSRQAEYQEIWERIAPDFFRINQEVVELPWRFSEYRFYIAAFFSHASWGKNNLLAIWQQRIPNQFYFMNAYELFLTHHFEITDQIYPKRPVSDNHIWSLAEISAFFLTFKTPEFKDKLWPQASQEVPGYKQLIKPAKDLYPVFSSAKDYTDWTQKGIHYIKTYSQEDLTS